MSLRPKELAQICEELDRSLRGAVVQKLHLPSVARGYLELRQPGRTALLCLCVEPQLGRVSIAQERSVRAEAPPALQRVWRTRLTGARIAEVAFEPACAARIDFEKGGERYALQVDLERLTLQLFDGAGKPLGGVARPGAGASSDAEASSRLVPVEGGAFPLAEAAEALIEGKGRTLAAETLRRERLKPLKTKRARIARTIAKVEEEAARGTQAEAHRRAGELLQQNLHRIARGQTSAKVTEYTEEGPREVELPLDPARSPKEQVEWHFHQYRRLTRGVAHAQERLERLREELAQVEGEMERVRVAPPEALGEVGPAPRVKEGGPQRHLPYKTFFGRGGERILVGRGGADNDALTFKVARSHDFWLHARGVPGAHVVVPLERGAVLPQELLLDAAHLALHHSGARGEPKGEVSYVQAKYVRHARGGAPGAVSYTQERTFVVRIEAERLSRLLESQAKA